MAPRTWRTAILSRPWPPTRPAAKSLDDNPTSGPGDLLWKLDTNIYIYTIFNYTIFILYLIILYLYYIYTIFILYLYYNYYIDLCRSIYYSYIHRFFPNRRCKVMDFAFFFLPKSEARWAAWHCTGQAEKSCRIEEAALHKEAKEHKEFDVPSPKYCENGLTAVVSCSNSKLVVKWLWMITNSKVVIKTSWDIQDFHWFFRIMKVY